MRTFILISTFGVLISCSPKNPVFKFDEKDLILKMEKGGCFGKCPVYSLELFKGGQSRLIGVRDYDKLGTFQKSLESEEYIALIEAFEASNYVQFDKTYKSNIPDYPLVKLGYKGKGADMIHVVEGKMERPEEVKQLQQLIEKIAASNGWEKIAEPEIVEEVVEFEEKKEDENKYDKSEIILEPNDNVHLAKWFQSKREAYGVRIVNRIAPNLNLWLISYDQSKIDGDALLEILNADPDIKTANFNKKTTQR